jgi:hypothetical protein
MDGVICRIDHVDYALRTPISETINLIKELSEGGNLIIIHTGRHIDKLLVTKSWLRNNAAGPVMYDHIQFGKPVADVYIDDKALRFDGEWTLPCLQQLP